MWLYYQWVECYRQFIFNTFYSDMSYTFQNINRLKQPANRAYQPPPEVIPPSNTDIIPINCYSYKAIDMMMAKILSFVTTQGTIENKLICQANSQQIKNYFKQYTQIINQLTILFNRTKNQSILQQTINKAQTENSFMEDRIMEFINLRPSAKLPAQVKAKVHEAGFKLKNKNSIENFLISAIQNASNIKSIQSTLKQAESRAQSQKEKKTALQQAINCLENSSIIRLPYQLSDVLNQEINQKIIKLMQMKQTIITVEDKLKQHRVNLKGSSLLERILQPLQKVLKEVTSLNNNSKQKRESIGSSKDSMVIATLLSLNTQDYTNYDKNIKMVDPTTRVAINNLKEKIQNAKKANQKTEQSYNNNNKQIQFGPSRAQQNGKLMRRSPSNSYLPQRQINQTESNLKFMNRFQQFLYQQHQQVEKFLVKQKQQMLQSAINSESNQKQKQITALKTELQLAKSELQASKAELQDLKNRISERQKTQAMRQTESITKKTNETELQRRETQLKKEMTVTKQQLNESQWRQQQLKKEIAAIKQQLDQELQCSQQLKKQISTTKQQLNITKTKEQQLKSQEIELNSLVKDKTASIDVLVKQKQQWLEKMQKLEQQLLNFKEFEVLDEQEQVPVVLGPTKGQYFGIESWVSATDLTRQAGEAMIQEIERVNGKHFKSSTLLYRYSPQNKLLWQHFVNKPNLIIVIKTETNKFIGVYTLAPLIKPNTPSENTEEKAFIFQSTVNGGEACIYPLLPGKKMNACYGNCIAVGKSDLRFNTMDNILEGNFGYYGCMFDNKNQKIYNLLGTSTANRVKMVSYQIYSVVLSEEGKTKEQKQVVTPTKTKSSSTNNIPKTPYSESVNIIPPKFEREINELKIQLQKRESEIKQKTDLITNHEQKYKELKQEFEKAQLVKQEQSKINKAMVDNKKIQEEINALKRKHNKEKQQLTAELNYQIEQLNLRTEQSKKVEDERDQAEKKFKVEIGDLRKQLANRDTGAASRIQSNQTANRDAETIRTQKKDIEERNNQIYKLEVNIEQNTTQINKLKREIQGRNTEITNLNKTIDKLNTELSTCKATNDQLSAKLLLQSKQRGRQPQTPSYKPRPSTEAKNLKFTPSSRKTYSKYEQLANANQMEPALVAHINRFFDTNLLEGRLDYKLKLVKEMERVKGLNFLKAKMIFQYDSLNLNSFHKYIDGTSNILLVVQTVKGVTVAGYYSGVYTKAEPMTKPGLLISLSTNESFELYTTAVSTMTSKYERNQRLFRGMTYDDYFILFGNAELRIRANEKTVFSNFGISNGYFNNRAKRVNDLLGDGENREIEFKSYEIYEVFFEDPAEQTPY